MIKKYFDRPPSPPVATASVQKVALPLHDKPSIAVLPFENMTGDPKQEYFADEFVKQLKARVTDAIPSHTVLPDEKQSNRTAGRSYEYRVDSTEVVRAEETRVLDPIDAAVLTLVTCYPFEDVGHAPNRFIVRASRSLP